MKSIHRTELFQLQHVLIHIQTMSSSSKVHMLTSYFTDTFPCFGRHRVKIISQNNQSKCRHNLNVASNSCSSLACRVRALGVFFFFTLKHYTARRPVLKGTCPHALQMTAVMFSQAMKPRLKGEACHRDKKHLSYDSAGNLWGTFLQTDSRFTQVLGCKLSLNSFKLFQLCSKPSFSKNQYMCH